MKRRSFISKAGKLLITMPVAFSAVSLLDSCKKPSEGKWSEAPIASSSKFSVADEKISILQNDSIIDGYTDRQSYFPNEQCELFVSARSSQSSKGINVYDMGGNITFVIPFSNVYTQKVNPNAPYENGFDYSDALSFFIPGFVKSGVYLIANKIPLIVKSLSSDVDFTVVYPLNTENAYCSTGGRSLYSDPVAKIVSFLRPIPFTVFGAGFLQWLYKQDYNINMIVDSDLDEAENFKGSLLVVPGHNEYWTRIGRNNFDNFVDKGNDVALLSGNNMWWQVRYADKKNKLICYRTTTEDPDPNPLNKTILWTEKQLGYSIVSSVGADWDGGGYGIRYPNDGGWDGYKICNPDSPLFFGLNLKKGDVISCPTHEYDGAPLSGFDKDGFPVINNKVLKFYKVELIGYDFGFRLVSKTVPTALLFKKKSNSGTVVNMASTNWCTEENMLKNNPVVLQKITKNIIEGLLKKQNLFT